MPIDNNDFRRDANSSLVARSIWRKPRMSRADIARELGLNRSTVTNIVQWLVDSGLVVEDEGAARGGEARDGAAARPGGGRRPVPLRISETAGLVLGLELRPSLYRAVLADPLGRVLRSTTGTVAFHGGPAVDPEAGGETGRAVDPARGTEGALTEGTLTEGPLTEGPLTEGPLTEGTLTEGTLGEGTLGEAAEAVLAGLSRTFLRAGDPPLLGAGIGVPGIVAPDRGVVILSDAFGSKGFPLAAAASSILGVPVLAENDANCCAWRQLTATRSDGLQDFLCLIAEPRPERNESRPGPSGGTGVGIGVALGGEVHYGKRYASGEFLGAIPRPGRSDAEYAPFVARLLTNLVPVVSVLDAQAVFLHGELCRRRDLVEAVLEGEGAEFRSALQRCDCELAFSDGGDFDVASGAASMFLQRLFAVPELSGRRGAPSVEWARVFELAARR